MVTVVIAVILAMAVGIGVIVGAKTKVGTGIVLGIMTLVAVMALGSLEVVEEGHAGVKKVFGSVSPNPLYNGVNWVEPWADTNIYTTRQTPLTMSTSNGNVITAPSSDNLNMTIDVTIKYQPVIRHLPWLHENLGPNYESKILVPLVREMVRNSVAEFDGMQVYSTHKEELVTTILEKVRAGLIKEAGVETTHAQGEKEIQSVIKVVNVNLRNVEAPQKIKDAISEKLAKQQEEQRKEYELNIAEKDAEIKITEAEGLAESQRIINESLTPAYLQHEAIQAYERLADSDNTTFIIMPTSTEGAGLPLILQGGTSNINQRSDQAAGQSAQQ